MPLLHLGDATQTGHAGCLYQPHDRQHVRSESPGACPSRGLLYHAAVRVHPLTPVASPMASAAKRAISGAWVARSYAKTKLLLCRSAGIEVASAPYVPTG